MIPDSEISTWTKGDNVCIVAGTGKGKSYFIKTALVEYARAREKKILFLVHRTILKEQIELEVEELGVSDVFVVETYQFIELLKQSKETAKLDAFDYIVADEFHYFLADATFNRSTEISLNEVMKTKSIRIFMSATPNDMIKYFTEFRGLEIKKYEMPVTFDFVKSLTFIYGVDRIKEATYNTIGKGKKTMIFTTAGQRRMESLMKEFPLNMAYASPSNGKLYSMVDPNKINEMILNKRFEESVLITTTAMDAGVSLFDRDIETIILDVREPNDIIQCLGRKRQVDEFDKIDLFIVVPHEKIFKDDVFKNKELLSALQCIQDNDLSTYLYKYHRNTHMSKYLDNIVSMNVMKSFISVTFNHLAKFKLQKTVDTLLDYENYGSMDVGFIMNIESMLGYENAPILKPLEKSYTNKRKKEYWEKEKAKIKKEKQKKESERIKRSDEIVENDKYSFTKLSDWLDKKSSTKYITPNEKKNLLTDISRLACTNVTTIPKANKELERLNLPYELQSVSVRINGTVNRRTKIVTCNT